MTILIWLMKAAAGLILLWCLALPRWRRLQDWLERTGRRRWRIPGTYTFGRCMGCGRLWQRNDRIQRGGCLCGNRYVRQSRPATMLEAFRMTLRLALK